MKLFTLTASLVSTSQAQESLRLLWLTRQLSTLLHLFWLWGTPGLRGWFKGLGRQGSGSGLGRLRLVVVWLRRRCSQC